MAKPWVMPKAKIPKKMHPFQDDILDLLDRTLPQERLHVLQPYSLDVTKRRLGSDKLMQ